LLTNESYFSILVFIRTYWAFGLMGFSFGLSYINLLLIGVTGPLIVFIWLRFLMESQEHL